MNFPKVVIFYIWNHWFSHIHQSRWLKVGETLDIEIDFEKRIHLLYFKCPIFYKKNESRWVIVGETLKFLFIQFRLQMAPVHPLIILSDNTCTIFFTFYQSKWLIVGEMLQFDIDFEKKYPSFRFQIATFLQNYQSRLQFSNSYKSVQEHCLR